MKNNLRQFFKNEKENFYLTQKVETANFEKIISKIGENKVYKVKSFYSKYFYIVPALASASFLFAFFFSTQKVNAPQEEILEDEVANFQYASVRSLEKQPAVQDLSGTDYKTELVKTIENIGDSPEEKI